MLLDRFRKKVPVREHTFEYRVIEKKRRNGDVYYIGQSTEIGMKTMLTTSPYRRLTEGRKPVFRLVNIQAARKQAEYGGSKYEYFEFDDPCAAKEAVCQVRWDNARALENSLHRRIVSEGECNEYC